MKLVYIHGYGSVADMKNPKVVELQKAGYDVEVVGYDSNARYETIQRSLMDQIARIPDCVLVGTSLGGYWAAQIAEVFGLPFISINPCINPETSLEKYGVDGRVLTSYIARPYEPRGTVAQLLLLDMDDDVIDAHATFKRLVNTCMIQTWQHGSHRFDHMAEAIPTIKVFLNHCENLNY